MLNDVKLCGRLTANPELKTTPNGVSVTSFSIAVDRDWQSGSERSTDFINIVAWRHTAEFICKYFNKGKLIILSGMLQVRNYNDKNGNKRSVTEVVADKCWFAGDKAAEQESSDVAYANNENDFTEIEDDDDGLPF